VVDMSYDAEITDIRAYHDSLTVLTASVSSKNNWFPPRSMNPNWRECLAIIERGY